MNRTILVQEEIKQLQRQLVGLLDEEKCLNSEWIAVQSIYDQR